MAITFTAGTAANTGTGSTGNTVPLAVTCTAATSVQISCIALTQNTSPDTVTTPTGWTLLTSTEHTSTTNARTSFFYQKGPVSSATVSLVLGGNGRAGAYPFTISGIDMTTPFGTPATGTAALTAPTVTPGTTNQMLLTVHGYREPSGSSTPSFTWTPPSGMTELGEAVSAATNLTTEAGCEVNYLQLTTTAATGTKVATNTAVTGGASGAISVVLLPGSGAAVAPDAPAITTTAGNTTVSVTWSAPFNGGSAITSYNLQRTTTSGSGYTDIPSTNGIASGATSYSDTGRTNGTIYYYRLKATNAVGSSAYSSESAVTPTTSGGAGTGQIGVYQSIPGLLALWPLDSTYQLQDVIGGRNMTNNGSVTFGSTGATFNGSNYLSAAANATVFNWGNQAKNGWSMMCQRSISDYASGSRDPNSSSYCHYMGVGSTFTNAITVFRHYFDPDTSGQTRPRRESGYAFNPTDEWNNNHQGAGSYWQENDALNTFVFKCLTINTTYTGESTTYPGQTKLYKNAVLKDTDTLYGAGTYRVYAHPSNSAPFRIGQVHDGSGFIGTVKMAAIYDHELTQSEITTLNNSTGLAIGTPGGGGQNTVPTAPATLTVTRNSSDSSLATATWTAPSSNGGAAVDGYKVSWISADGNSTFVTPSDVTSPYSLSGLPTQGLTVTVQAHNSVGYGGGKSATLAAVVALPLLGTLTDNFSGAADTRRVFSTGVVQQNGDLEWTTIDTTARGTYIRGNLISQAAFYKMTPSTTSNDATVFYARSTATPAAQIRIAVWNNTIYSKFSNPTDDGSGASRAYSSTVDKYWRISHNGTNILLETSPDSTNWTALGHSGFTAPSWSDDVQLGIEVYNTVSFS